MQIIDRFVEWLYNKRFPERVFEHSLYKTNQIVLYKTKDISAFYDVFNKEIPYDDTDIKRALISAMATHLMDCIEVTKQEDVSWGTRYWGHLKVYKREKKDYLEVEGKQIEEAENDI